MKAEKLRDLAAEELEAKAAEIEESIFRLR